MIASGQTEVEGEVSGEWTAEGSPYIVVDSTWVPEDERLILREGVEVQFEEGQGLYIYGTLDALGTERDSVHIRVAEDVEHWRGLRFYGQNRTEWNYASFICPDTAIILDSGYALTITNSLLYASVRPIAGIPIRGIEGCRITLNYCIFLSSDSHYSTGGRFSANHSYFDFSNDPSREPGFWSSGCSYVFNACTVVGSLYESFGSAVIDSCRWLRFEDDRHIGVAASGPRARMTETYVEGAAGAVGVDGSIAIFSNNEIIEGATFSRCSPRISGCTIGGDIFLSECETSTITNTIAEGFSARHCNIITVDSSFFNLDGSDYASWIYDVSSLTFRHCVTRMSFLISHDDVEQFYFDHNTLIFDEENDHISARPDSSWSNNIFISLDPVDGLFTTEYIPTLRYNCFWGFDAIAGPYDDPVLPDSTNIISDPLIEWYDIIPLLSSNSPCIDRGDPDAPHDPDGSRSDIGAYFFDHNVFVDDPFTVPSSSFIVSAFPNPFNNTLSLSFSSAAITPISINLVDISGRTVLQTMQKFIPYGTGLVSLNTKSLPSGHYVLLVKTSRYTKAIPVNCLK